MKSEKEIINKSYIQCDYDYGGHNFIERKSKELGEWGKFPKANTLGPGENR